MNDELANDRTFLAWLRTGIALFGLGFVVAKVAFFVQADPQVTNEGLYAAVGIVFVLAGGVLVGVGYWQHKTVLELLRANDSRPLPRWPRTITATAVAGCVLLSVLIGVST